MVRETRYLLIRNISDKSTEESLSQHFKRYGKIQNIKIQPPSDEQQIQSIIAKVAFTDIRSASNAYQHKHVIDGHVLLTEYWDSHSVPLRVSKDNSSVISSGYGRCSTSSNAVNRKSNSGSLLTSSGVGAFGCRSAASAWPPVSCPDDQLRPPECCSVKLPAVHCPSGKPNNCKAVLWRSASCSRSCSPHSCSGSASSLTNYSTEGSFKSKSASYDTASGRMPSTVRSAVSNVIFKDRPLDTPNDSSEDSRLLGICITGLPARSSDYSLREGLFHEYKKFGKVTSVRIVSEPDRHAVVSFRMVEDAVKALDASQGKMFFGTKIRVTAHEGIRLSDNDLWTQESEQDEFHVKATRTLFVGNLAHDTVSQHLLDTFGAFGDVIDIDIKRQGTATAYAFVQYMDISSVVNVLREMEGHHIGSSKIKLGFGKSMPTNCIWVEMCGGEASDRNTCRMLQRFGDVTHRLVDGHKRRVLFFYADLAQAKCAVSRLKIQSHMKRRFMVDYASRECQKNFLEHLGKSGQLSSGSRFDERSMSKMPQHYADYHDSLMKDREMPECYQPMPECYRSTDDYGQVLRQYSHRQHEQRDDIRSPTCYDVLHLSKDLQVDKHDAVDTRFSLSPSHDHDVSLNDCYRSCSVNGEVLSGKFTVHEQPGAEIERHRSERLLSPGAVCEHRQADIDSLTSRTPILPTELEYPCSLHSSRSLEQLPDVRSECITERRGKLRDVLLTDSVSFNSAGSSENLVNNVTVEGACDLRKYFQEKLPTAGTKRKGDTVGILSLKKITCEKDIRRRQKRFLGKSGVCLSSLDDKCRKKTAAISRLCRAPSSEEIEPENDSVSELELQSLRKRKANLLVELEQETLIEPDVILCPSSSGCYVDAHPVTPNDMSMKRHGDLRVRSRPCTGLKVSVVSPIVPTLKERRGVKVGTCRPAGMNSFHESRALDSSDCGIATKSVVGHGNGTNVPSCREISVDMCHPVCATAIVGGMSLHSIVDPIVHPTRSDTAVVVSTVSGACTSATVDSSWKVCGRSGGVGALFPVASSAGEGSEKNILSSCAHGGHHLSCSLCDLPSILSSPTLVDSCLSESSGDDNVSLLDQSIEDRIRNIDEIMRKSAVIGMAGSPPGHTDPLLESSGSAFSNMRFRRCDLQSPGGAPTKTPHRKPEPSDIMQRVLSRPSILDQDYNRLGQHSGSKFVYHSVIPSTSTLSAADGDFTRTDFTSTGSGLLRLPVGSGRCSASSMHRFTNHAACVSILAATCCRPVSAIAVCAQLSSTMTHLPTATATTIPATSVFGSRNGTPSPLCAPASQSIVVPTRRPDTVKQEAVEAPGSKVVRHSGHSSLVLEQDCDTPQSSTAAPVSDDMVCVVPADQAVSSSDVLHNLSLHRSLGMYAGAKIEPMGFATCAVSVLATVPIGKGGNRGCVSGSVTGSLGLPVRAAIVMDNVKDVECKEQLPDGNCKDRQEVTAARTMSSVEEPAAQPASMNPTLLFSQHLNFSEAVRTPTILTSAFMAPATVEVVRSDLPANSCLSNHVNSSQPLLGGGKSEFHQTQNFLKTGNEISTDAELCVQLDADRKGLFQLTDGGSHRDNTGLVSDDAGGGCGADCSPVAKHVDAVGMHSLCAEQATCGVDVPLHAGCQDDCDAAVTLEHPVPSAMRTIDDTHPDKSTRSVNMCVDACVEDCIDMVGAKQPSGSTRSSNADKAALPASRIQVADVVDESYIGLKECCRTGGGEMKDPAAAVCVKSKSDLACCSKGKVDKSHGRGVLKGSGVDDRRRMIDRGSLFSCSGDKDIRLSKGERNGKQPSASRKSKPSQHNGARESKGSGAVTSSKTDVHMAKRDGGVDIGDSSVKMEVTCSSNRRSGQHYRSHTDDKGIGTKSAGGSICRHVASESGRKSKNGVVQAVGIVEGTTVKADTKASRDHSGVSCQSKDLKPACVVKSNVGQCERRSLDTKHPQDSLATSTSSDVRETAVSKGPSHVSKGERKGRSVKSDDRHHSRLASYGECVATGNTAKAVNADSCEASSRCKVRESGKISTGEGKLTFASMPVERKSHADVDLDSESGCRSPRRGLCVLRAVPFTDKVRQVNSSPHISHAKTSLSVRPGEVARSDAGSQSSGKSVSRLSGDHGRVLKGSSAPPVSQAEVDGVVSVIDSRESCKGVSGVGLHVHQPATALSQKTDAGYRDKEHKSLKKATADVGNLEGTHCASTQKVGTTGRDASKYNAPKSVEMNDDSMNRKHVKEASICLTNRGVSNGDHKKRMSRVAHENVKSEDTNCDNVRHCKQGEEGSWHHLPDVSKKDIEKENRHHKSDGRKQVMMSHSVMDKGRKKCEKNAEGKLKRNKLEQSEKAECLVQQKEKSSTSDEKGTIKRIDDSDKALCKVGMKEEEKRPLKNESKSKTAGCEKARKNMDQKHDRHPALYNHKAGKAGNRKQEKGSLLKPDSSVSSKCSDDFNFEAWQDFFNSEEGEPKYTSMYDTIKRRSVTKTASFKTTPFSNAARSKLGRLSQHTKKFIAVSDAVSDESTHLLSLSDLDSEKSDSDFLSDMIITPQQVKPTKRHVAVLSEDDDDEQMIRSSFFPKKTEQRKPSVSKLRLADVFSSSSDSDVALKEISSKPKPSTPAQADQRHPHTKKVGAHSARQSAEKSKHKPSFLITASSNGTSKRNGNAPKKLDSPDNFATGKGIEKIVRLHEKGGEPPFKKVKTSVEEKGYPTKIRKSKPFKTGERRMPFLEKEADRCPIDHQSNVLGLAVEDESSKAVSLIQDRCCKNDSLADKEPLDAVAVNVKVERTEISSIEQTRNAGEDLCVKNVIPLFTGKPSVGIPVNTETSLHFDDQCFVAPGTANCEQKLQGCHIESVGVTVSAGKRTKREPCLEKNVTVCGCVGVSSVGTTHGSSAKPVRPDCVSDGNMRRKTADPGTKHARKSAADKPVINRSKEVKVNQSTVCKKASFSEKPLLKKKTGKGGVTKAVVGNGDAGGFSESRVSANTPKAKTALSGNHCNRRSKKFEDRMLSDKAILPNTGSLAEEIHSGADKPVTAYGSKKEDDLFFSFWGHPAPIIHKKRDTLGKWCEGGGGDVTISVETVKTLCIDNDSEESITGSSRFAKSANVIDDDNAPLDNAASSASITAEGAKRLIGVPVKLDCDKCENDLVLDDIELLDKPSKKKAKKDCRRGRKQSDPFAVVEHCLAGTGDKDDVTISQDVNGVSKSTASDCKVISADSRCCSFEASQLSMNQQREGNETKSVDAEVFVGSSQPDIDDAASLASFKPEKFERPFFDGHSVALVEGNATNSDDSHSQRERDEREQQAASEEAAVAVQAIMGSLDDDPGNHDYSVVAERSVKTCVSSVFNTQSNAPSNCDPSFAMTSSSFVTTETVALHSPNVCRHSHVAESFLETLDASNSCADDKFNRCFLASDRSPQTPLSDEKIVEKVSQVSEERQFSTSNTAIEFGDQTLGEASLTCFSPMSNGGEDIHNVSLASSTSHYTVNEVEPEVIANKCLSIVPSIGVISCITSPVTDCFKSSLSSFTSYNDDVLNEADVHSTHDNAGADESFSSLKCASSRSLEIKECVEKIVSKSVLCDGLQNDFMLADSLHSTYLTTFSSIENSTHVGSLNSTSSKAVLHEVCSGINASVDDFPKMGLLCEESNLNCVLHQNHNLERYSIGDAEPVCSTSAHFEPPVSASLVSPTGLSPSATASQSSGLSSEQTLVSPLAPSGVHACQSIGSCCCRQTQAVGNQALPLSVLMSHQGLSNSHSPSADVNEVKAGVDSHDFENLTAHLVMSDVKLSESAVPFGITADALSQRLCGHSAVNGHSATGGDDAIQYSLPLSASDCSLLPPVCLTSTTWQQSIVKEDVASPESRTDLDSSYGEAELVINLEEQCTPTSGDDSGKAVYQTDSDEKSPADVLLTIPCGKRTMLSRLRRPTNYKAMDQGLLNAVRCASSLCVSRVKRSPRLLTTTPKLSTAVSPRSPHAELSSVTVKLEKLKTSCCNLPDAVPDFRFAKDTFLAATLQQTGKKVGVEQLDKANIYDFELNDNDGVEDVPTLGHCNRGLHQPLRVSPFLGGKACTIAGAPVCASLPDDANQVCSAALLHVVASRQSSCATTTTNGHLAAPVAGVGLAQSKDVTVLSGVAKGTDHASDAGKASILRKPLSQSAKEVAHAVVKEMIADQAVSFAACHADSVGNPVCMASVGHGVSISQLSKTRRKNLSCGKGVPAVCTPRPDHLGTLAVPMCVMSASSDRNAGMCSEQQYDLLTKDTSSDGRWSLCWTTTSSTVRPLSCGMSDLSGAESKLSTVRHGSVGTVLSHSVQHPLRNAVFRNTVMSLTCQAGGAQPSSVTSLSQGQAYSGFPYSQSDVCPPAYAVCGSSGTAMRSMPFVQAALHHQRFGSPDHVMLPSLQPALDARLGSGAVLDLQPSDPNAVGADSLVSGPSCSPRTTTAVVSSSAFSGSLSMQHVSCSANADRLCHSVSLACLGPRERRQSMVISAPITVFASASRAGPAGLARASIPPVPALVQVGSVAAMSQRTPTCSLVGLPWFACYTSFSRPCMSTPTAPIFTHPSARPITPLSKLGCAVVRQQYPAFGTLAPTTLDASSSPAVQAADAVHHQPLPGVLSPLPGETHCPLMAGDVQHPAYSGAGLCPYSVHGGMRNLSCSRVTQFQSGRDSSGDRCLGSPSDPTYRHHLGCLPYPGPYSSIDQALSDLAPLQSSYDGSLIRPVGILQARLPSHGGLRHPQQQGSFMSRVRSPANIMASVFSHHLQLSQSSAHMSGMQVYPGAKVAGRLLPGIHTPDKIRGPAVPDNVSQPAMHANIVDAAMLAKYTDDALRGVGPPTAHADTHSFPLELLHQRHMQQIIMARQEAARMASQAHRPLVDSSHGIPVDHGGASCASSVGGSFNSEALSNAVGAVPLASKVSTVSAVDSVSIASQEAFLTGQAGINISVCWTAPVTAVMDTRCSASRTSMKSEKCVTTLWKETALKNPSHSASLSHIWSVDLGNLGQIEQRGPAKTGLDICGAVLDRPTSTNHSSLQAVPLNLADSYSQTLFSLSQCPDGHRAESRRLSSSLMVGKCGGAEGHLRQADISPVVCHGAQQDYSGNVPFGSLPPFPVPRITIEPRLLPGQHGQQLLSPRDAVLPQSFNFVQQRADAADCLVKKGEMHSGSIPALSRPVSPIASTSSHMQLDMVKDVMDHHADAGHRPEALDQRTVANLGDGVSNRENLGALLMRYPLVWQGMLALKNDQSYVQMHFVSGSMDLPTMALPSQTVYNGQTLPLRISQRMRLEPSNLEGVTKRMINEKDYTLLLAVPCGTSRIDITEQTNNLTAGFIEYLRSKLAAGIVNVSQPGTNQPAFVVHIFPPCPFSMQMVQDHSRDLAGQVHDLAHVIIIITTVS